MIKVESLQKFAEGSRRECYIHPIHEDRCIKVWRQHCEPETLYKKASFSKRCRKTVDSFDENVFDHKTLSRLKQSEGHEIWRHIPRCYGFEETDRGPGLTLTLLRDYNNKISRSLLDRIWTDGNDKRYRVAFDEFVNFWSSHTIPTRTLYLHNIACQEITPHKFRLVLIDGFGSLTILPIAKISKQWALRQNHRKAVNLKNDIEVLLQQKQLQKDPGFQGFLTYL